MTGNAKISISNGFTKDDVAFTDLLTKNRARFTFNTCYLHLKNKKQFRKILRCIQTNENIGINLTLKVVSVTFLLVS